MVSTFELGTEEGSVLQLTEPFSWSEVGLETEFESCGNSEGGDGLGYWHLGAFLNRNLFIRHQLESQSDKSGCWGPTASIPASVSFLCLSVFRLALL